MSREQTVLQALIERLLAAAAYNPADEVAPVAVLWPDGESQWVELLPRLREALPQLLTLGLYDPTLRTGPGIWLRCMVERTLPEADWPADAVPIVYLPGISRQALREIKGLHYTTAIIVELQFRGVVWKHPNGRDWSIAGLLQSRDGGLGLDVSTDVETREAMRRALPVLADTAIAALQGHRLQAADFDELLHPDEYRQVLDWLSDPEGLRARWGEAEWDAFRSLCARSFGFDPEKDGAPVAAGKFGEREGPWATAWRRFCEAPANYPGVPAILRQARPQGDDNLFIDHSSWPQDNEQDEDALRQELLKLRDLPASEARQSLGRMEGGHGQRREWVWAKLGQAPLAMALAPLSELAQLTERAAGGLSAEEMGQAYAEGLWRVDACALEALAAASGPQDAPAIAAALRAVYAPWLEDAALHFQDRVQAGPFPGAHRVSPTLPEPGTCILFADGLRLDVAQRLRQALESEDCQAELQWHFSALPAVTATTKPAVSPVAARLSGGTGGDFLPAIDGQTLTTDRFRKLLDEQGVAFLTAGEIGDPTASGWTECGSLDRQGHDSGWKLALRVDEELTTLVARTRELLGAGWKEVIIVTDHGWLLCPGGLPKHDLPAFLTATRWGRCAELHPGAQVQVQTVPWHWGYERVVAVAPGISCFVAGKDFAHGGLSLQECVVPRLRVGARAGAGPQVTIEQVRWVGLRCRVKVTGGPGLTVDLRTRVADPGSSLAQSPNPVNAEGDGSVVVADDRHAGEAVHVVVLDGTGQCVATVTTTVGG